jgi:hypothetical protein
MNTATTAANTRAAATPVMIQVSRFIIIRIPGNGFTDELFAMIFR